MVGLIVEQHFLPIFTQILDGSKKYLASKDELNFGSELNCNKYGKYHHNHNDANTGKHGTGKWFGGMRFNKNLRNEEATVLEIQELLENSKVIFMKWKTEKMFTIGLADGKIIKVVIKNIFTGEYFYRVDRCYPFNELVSDMAYNDQLLMHLISDGRLYVTWKEKTSPESEFVEPDYTSMTFTNLLPNKLSKRCEKKLTLDSKSNTFGIWWSTSKDDILPWLPNPEQRANIFVYIMELREPVLLWYLKTENTLLEVHLRVELNMIIVLDHSVDSEGKISVTEIIHNITFRCKESETVVPLQSELTSHAYDQTISKLALTCCDSSVFIYCQESKLPRATKAAFIPSIVNWHTDSHLIFVAGDTGQYQLFDIALNPILILESNINTLSMTHELALCSTIQKSCWMPTNSQSGDSCLSIRFDIGPITILRLAVHSMKLLDLIKFYVCEECISEALNVLKNVQWITEESLQATYKIFKYLIKQSHSDEVECNLEKLLAVYFVPTPGSDDDSMRKSDLNAMKTLARRFFMWLLLGNKYHRALQIATSLNDMGLFYKLHQVALINDESDIASQAMQKLSMDDLNTSSSETDSGSSGSWSSTDSESCHSLELEKEVKNTRNQPNVNLCSNESLSEIKINSRQRQKLTHEVIHMPAATATTTKAINKHAVTNTEISVVDFGLV